MPVNPDPLNPEDPRRNWRYPEPAFFAYRDYVPQDDIPTNGFVIECVCSEGMHVLDADARRHVEDPAVVRRVVDFIKAHHKSCALPLGILHHLGPTPPDPGPVPDLAPLVADATYVCPQCGPDPRGGDVHSREMHTWMSDDDEDKDPGLLTEAEHAVMDQTEALTAALRDIVPPGTSSADDLREMLGHVHGIQAAVLAQAAVRAYHNRYRPLGGDPWPYAKGGILPRSVAEQVAPGAGS